LLREEALQIVAAYAASHGNAESVWQATKGASLTQTEHEGAYLGLVEGIAASSRAK
jgi:hypothetical protein